MEAAIPNRIKYISLIFLISLILGVGLLLWHPFAPSYYSSFDVTYGMNDRPLIITELQGKNCTLGLSIGSRFPLFLRKETLDAVDKQPQGLGEWNGIDGSKHEAPALA